MRIGIWPYDGFDLFYYDENEQSSPLLSFNTLEDAEWARDCWLAFIKEPQ